MKTWTMARFTFRETVRTRTMIIGLVISLLYLAIVPMLSTTSGGDAVVGETHNKLAAGRDFLSFALGGLNFIGMFMAIFTSLGAVFTEIENGTILVVATKPITRTQIISGKWLGHVMLMAGYVLIMGTVLWLSVAAGSGVLVWRFVPALLLVCLNVITMVSLTIFFSTFLPIVANAIFVFLMMVFTSNLRIINAIGQTSQSFLITTTANIFRMMLPVSEVSDLANQVLMGAARNGELSGADAAAFAPRGWSFLYELAYLGAMVVFSSYIFRKRDLNRL
ncbi:MAG: ABC transporter permease [Thermoleophilia bacterium]